MIPLVDSGEMKTIDKLTIEEIEIPSMVLMERAAYEVTRSILKDMTGDEKIIVICGAGNNGGDGIAVARMLFLKNVDVSVVFIGNEDKITIETKKQLKMIRNLNIREYNSSVDFGQADIIVDAIFGIGLSKPVKGSYFDIIKAVNHSSAKVYAVDIPSGVSADTGKVMGIAVRADKTITFGCMKIGLSLHPGTVYAGEIVVADIGFPQSVVAQVNPAAHALEPSDLSELPLRPDYSHKGTFGTAVIIAGRKNMSGACYLSAKAAYRSGCGLVKILTEASNRVIIQQLLPEAVLDTYEQGTICAHKIIENIDKAAVIVIGPGMGCTETARVLLEIILKNSKVPVIIDADGINILAAHPELLKMRTCPVILTPHVKEMAVLTRHDINFVKDNLIDICKETAGEYGVVCVLKDARTVITNKNGEIYINHSGNNGMAAGGSGDVLTGVIAGMICGGLNPFMAAAMGVYVHGLSGDEGAKIKGKYGLMATDIIDCIPMIVR